MSDGDWSDKESDEENQADVLVPPSVNIWNKFGVGIRGNNNQQKNVDKMYKKKKVECDFSNKFLRNLKRLTAKLYFKMALKKENTVIPGYFLFSQFREDGDFYDELGMESANFKEFPGSCEYVKNDKDDGEAIFNSLWKEGFSKTLKNEPFKALGQLSNHQAKKDVTFMIKGGTQEKYGEHTWETVKFKTLTLPLKGSVFSVCFILPFKQHEDGFKELEKLILREDLDSMKLINKEQVKIKMEYIKVPSYKLNKKIDFVTALKRLGFRTGDISCEVKVDFHMKGNAEPKKAPIKYKKDYKFFKSELNRPLHNVRSSTFVCDSAHMFVVYRNGSYAINCVGKIVNNPK